MHFGFAWQGLVIFILPMIINIAYVIFPPKEGESEPNGKYPVIEAVEQSARVIYFASLCILVSDKKLSYNSALLFAAVFFLVLYYICWIRYFVKGRDVSLLGKKFLLIPQPLAVFPVLYFLFAALWMHNYVAAAVMVVFGVAHNIVSYKNINK